MSVLLYKIPEALLGAIGTGHASLVGAVIKEVGSGRILAHVQPTGIFGAVMQSSLQGLGSTLSQGFNPLGIVTVIQNQQIKSRLGQLQSAMGLLQNLQVGTLAVSGMGLGVSVAGFAIMLKQLKKIENQISGLGDRIDRVTKDRRGDEVTSIFSDIASELETVDTLSSRNDPRRVAEDAQRGLAKAASRLQPHFERVMGNGNEMTVEDLDLLWSLAAAMRLCSDAGIKALFRIDELAVAAEIAQRQSQRFADLGSKLSADKLSRLIARKAATVEEMTQQRQKALAPAKTLVEGIRSTVLGLSEQSALAILLVDRGASGRSYLEEAEVENNEPLLCLPV